MFGFLNFDNPFVAGIYKLFNMILLSAMWLLFCIPVFTAGASTTALYYTVQKTIKNDRGNSWTCFWESFKTNFKQSTAVTLIFLAVAAVFMTDISAIRTLEDVGQLKGYATVFFGVLMVLLCIYAFWVFAGMARFKSTIKGQMKNALVLSVRHLPVTIAVALLGAGSLLLIWLMWPVVFVMPAVSVWLMSVLTEKVFRRYMTEEDKELEDELNMNWNDDYIGKMRTVKAAAGWGSLCRRKK